MARFGKSDIQALLVDAGHTVVLGGSSTKALVDRVGKPVVSGVGTAVGARRIVLTIETGTLTGLVAGAVMTINTTSYRAYEIHAIEDGELTRIWCERAS